MLNNWFVSFRNREISKYIMTLLYSLVISLSCLSIALDRILPHDCDMPNELSDKEFVELKGSSVLGEFMRMNIDTSIMSECGGYIIVSRRNIDSHFFIIYSLTGIEPHNMVALTFTPKLYSEYSEYRYGSQKGSKSNEIYFYNACKEILISFNKYDEKSSCLIEPYTIEEVREKGYEIIQK